MIDSSTIGPVEMMAVAFPGSHFNGEILPQLADLVDNGSIRVIDLVVVTKDSDGKVTSLEASELDPDAAARLATFKRDLDPDGLLGEDDLELAGQELEPGSTAALVVWEDRWAAPLVQAIRDAGGILLAHERISREVVENVVASATDA